MESNNMPHKKPVTSFVLFSGIIGTFFFSMFIRIVLRKIFTPLFNIQGDFQAFLSLPANIWITLLFVFIHATLLLAFLFTLLRKFDCGEVDWDIRKNIKNNLYVVGIAILAFVFLYAVIFATKDARFISVSSYSLLHLFPLLLILLLQTTLDEIAHHRFFLSGLLTKMKPEDVLGISAFLFGIFALLLLDLVPLGFLNYFVYGALSAFLFTATRNMALLFSVRFLYLLWISFSTLHLPSYTLSGFVFIPDNSGFIGGGYYGAEGSLLLTGLMVLGIGATYWFLLRKNQ